MISPRWPLSVKHLPADELVKIGGGVAADDHAIAVIGPGTGLGVSGLVPCGSHWSALQGEGGHVSLGVRTPREFAVYDQLMARFRHVSAERFLSGPGLVNIVKALRVVDGLPEREFSPAEVSQFGMQAFEQAQAGKSVVVQNDEVSAADQQCCEEALQIFCSLLGSCAGNLVLTLGAEGGVYIGGGVVPRLGEFFVQSQIQTRVRGQGAHAGLP